MRGAALGSDSGVTGDSLCGLEGAVIFQKIRDAGSPAYLRRRFSMSAASIGTRARATSFLLSHGRRICRLLVASLSKTLLFEK
jgi:hypothetical protein